MENERVDNHELKERKTKPPGFNLGGPGKSCRQEWKKESLPILHANRTEMLKLYVVPCSAFSCQICTMIKYINKLNDRVVVRNCRRKVHCRRCVREITVERWQNAIIGNLIKIDCFEILPFLRLKIPNCVAEQTVNLWYRSFHHFSRPHKCECRNKYEKCVWI